MSGLIGRFIGRIALLTTVALVGVVVPSATAQAASPTITFTGHGWGHGRGMGQYGALGYAVNYGWSSAQILDHFYGGTTAGNIGGRDLSIELMAVTGAPLAAIGRGLTINGAGRPDANADGSSVRVTLQGASYVVQTGASCAGPWTTYATFASPVTIGTTSQGSFGSLVRACEATGERAYRGVLVAQRNASTGAQANVNLLPVEDYLRGVVPKESPSSWGLSGGGRGMQALMAQAVAARSYGLSGTRPSGATTCDTTTCQVYGGAAFQPWSQAQVVVDATTTNQAIDATAGVVRFAAGTSTIVRTEFSSSTGGYTAGGTFPAVEDLGDATASNPNHSWTTSVDLATAGANLGTGAISSISVTGRNGLGADGGRVTTVRVINTAGQTRDFTGNQVRVALGLKSDWFTISGIGSGIVAAEAQQVVRALYQDVLGRGVDPSGLQTWTDYVVRTGNPGALAQQIATSRERMSNLVAAQYRLALHREPEQDGLDFWVRYLEAGRGVYDLQVGIYGSPESLNTLGGGDVSTWVGVLYDSMLGRPAAVAERQYWTQIAASQGRSAVASYIARSDEACMRRLTVYYQTFLLRDVDPAGRATFLPLMTGRGDFDIPIALGGSPEYWARSQTRTF